MKHGIQKTIANNLDISCSYLNDLIRGRTKCPPAMALRLERLTGINRSIWVWGSTDEIKSALDEKYPKDQPLTAVNEGQAGCAILLEGSIHS